MTIKELSIQSGVPERRILFYSEQGIFPKIKLKVGRGHPRIYTETDLQVLRIVKNLSEIGFELKKIKEIVSDK